MTATQARIPKSLTHSIDWTHASHCIRELGDRVIVEMLPIDAPTRLAIPDSLREHFRSHVGVILRSPGYSYTTKGVTFDAPDPGTMVLVHPDDGVHISGAEMGEYVPGGEIRVYGAFAEYVGNAQSVEWWHSILATIDEDMTIRACGDKTLFRKDKASGKTGTGIYLPDGHHERSEMATIISRGPLAHPDAKTGDRVSYNPHYVGQDGVDLGTGVMDFDYFIASDLVINFILERG
jgi:co-chaperonin GroES (HSP10)